MHELKVEHDRSNHLLVQVGTHFDLYVVREQQLDLSPEWLEGLHQWVLRFSYLLSIEFHHQTRKPNQGSAH